ncbi:hypothetical protein [Urechidicola vernalis]|uniref:Glycine zipper family protein n=1 Tax=Urechidicola vernalis TaxID=3075600 RepID=A0ABU2Y9G8_9FLAO|nr:hypothetical protein [Urechidicola sp. P050]MDT0553900.1 hypothetical protein [Urechidicola sp. P050]
MKIEKLNIKSEALENPKLDKVIAKMNLLITDLNTKEIPVLICDEINAIIKTLNRNSEPETEQVKNIKKAYCKILKILEKKLKMVPKNHYRNLWMAIGISIFGVVFGSVLSSSTGNSSYIGIGIPIGVAIGIAVGTDMDKKAFKNGKQLKVSSRL